MIEKLKILARIDEELGFKFLFMPRAFLKNEYYRDNLTTESKIAYSFLLDELISLVRNDLIDPEDIYIIFPRKKLMNILNISDKTATKVYKDLMECGIITEKKVGLGMPNKIYIKKLFMD